MMRNTLPPLASIDLFGAPRLERGQFFETRQSIFYPYV